MIDQAWYTHAHYLNSYKSVFVFFLQYVLMDIYIPNITTNNLIGFHNMTSHSLVGNRVLPASLSIRNKKLTLTLK